MLREEDIEIINQIIKNGGTAEVRKRKSEVLIFEVKKQIKAGN